MLNPWRRIRELEAKLAEMRDDLEQARISEARATAQTPLLKAFLEDEKKAKENAFDRLALALNTTPIYEQPTPAVPGEPVTFGNNNTNWLIEAQRLEDEANRKLQNEKLENLAKYRREADEAGTAETADAKGARQEVAA